MNCPNCGRPLAEGEVCNCTNEAAYAPQEQQNYYQPQPNQEYYQPQPNAYYAPPAAPEAPIEVPARTDYPEGYKVKKKYVAVILAVTLGPLGIHNFYLGNKNKGLAQLLVCLIGSLFVGLGYIVAYVWALVEAVQLFTEKLDKDAEGFKIRTFEESIVAEKIKAEKALKEAEAAEEE